MQLKFTGGEDGIQAVPRGHLFGIFDLGNNLVMYYFVLAVFLAGFALIYRTIHSPFGQVLKAIRENEPRAVSLGYKVDQYKLTAFVMSAALAGLAGGTKAIVFQLASLTDITWQMSGEVVLMTLLGGLGTIFGPVVGAFLVVTLAELSGRHPVAGDGGDRRDLRRLRPAVPPRHRRRDRGAAEALERFRACGNPSGGNGNAGRKFRCRQRHRRRQGCGAEKATGGGRLRQEPGEVTISGHYPRACGSMAGCWRRGCLGAGALGLWLGRREARRGVEFLLRIAIEIFLVGVGRWSWSRW